MSEHRSGDLECHWNPDGRRAIFIQDHRSFRMYEATTTIHMASHDGTDNHVVETRCPISKRRTAQPRRFYVTDVPAFCTCRRCLSHG